MKNSFRCWAEIDCEALRHNARVVQEKIGASELLAVVKANAYGHGLVEVARALADEAKYFGVANLEEAVTLRASVAQPIMIFGPALREERAEIAARKFIPSISTAEEAREFAGLTSGSPVAVNFVVDTGMGRMGTPENSAAEVFKKVAALEGIALHSVSTHLPSPSEDADYTRGQLARFTKVLARFRAEAATDFKVHVLPSAGVLAFPEGKFEIVRAGLVLYGISPLPEFQNLLRPVLTWKTRIALVRELARGSSISYGRTFVAPRPMRVATLAAGYADGYPRQLSNHGTEALAGGRRCALLGRVTMDLMMLDVSNVTDAQVGDEVVLLGRQGDEEISATELAERAETIPWEITTRIGSRVRRVYA